MNRCTLLSLELRADQAEKQYFCCKVGFFHKGNLHFIQIIFHVHWNGIGPYCDINDDCRYKMYNMYIPILKREEITHSLYCQSRTRTKQIIRYRAIATANIAILPQKRGYTKPMGTSYNLEKVRSGAPDVRFGK